jgi:cytochrome c peroxidase/serine/threonine protein kinase
VISSRPNIPAEGDIVAGKYRVERILGKGGMGMVVAAEHLSLRQRVAIKFLLLLGRPEANERFEREARAAAAIQSPHVARIIDIGAQESGARYIVMEFLTGRDLAAHVRERGPLPVSEAVGHILQACEAMAEAHSRGILHRDIKPANLFLSVPMSGPPLVKILDFGLAKTLPTGGDGHKDDSITSSNMVIGSVNYMSPEHVKSLKHADARSDIWSLGVSLYELCTATRPFQGSSQAHSMLKITMEPPAPIPPGTVPPGLEAAILRCLEKDPARRPQTIAELAEMLAPFGPPEARASLDRIHQWQPSRRPASPSPEEIAAQAPTVAEPGTGSTRAVPPATAARPRRRWLKVAVWVLVPAAAAGVGAWLGRQTRSASPTMIDTDRLASFAPLPGVVSPAEPVTRARVELGRRLFADPRLSSSGDVACTSCHPLDRYGADGRKLSRGTQGREPPRNTPSIYNLSGVFALLWDGRQEDLVDQAKEVMLSRTAMGMTPELVAERLRALPDYTRRFATAFPGRGEPVTFDNTARALAAYQATLFSRGRWDRFLEGDRSALSDDEQAGFNRFVEVGCVTCHFGPNVGATMFQKVGLVKAWPDTRDRGRYEITHRDDDWMVFRVPPLRNVQKTAPYFHDGSVSNLSTAIRLMARHQLGKELGREDVRLIHAWLTTLTGDTPAPAAPSDTANAMPAARD